MQTEIKGLKSSEMFVLFSTAVFDFILKHLHFKGSLFPIGSDSSHALKVTSSVSHAQQHHHFSEQSHCNYCKMGQRHRQRDKYRGSQTSTSVRLPQYAETRFLSGDDEPPRWPASVAVELAIFGLHHLTEALDGLLGVAGHPWREQPVLLVLLDDEVERI